MPTTVSPAVAPVDDARGEGGEGRPGRRATSTYGAAAARARSTQGQRRPPRRPTAAGATKSCPSACSPMRATNRPPGPASRESVTTGAVDDARSPRVVAVPGRRRPPVTLRDLGQGQRRSRRHRPARRGCQRLRARTASRSSNGCDDPADLLALSRGPCRATATVAAPGRPGADAPRRWRARAVADLDDRRPAPRPPAARARPRATAARIAAGSSERGLSSVTTTRSAPAARRGAPMSGPLAAVAVAAGAERRRRAVPRRRRAQRRQRGRGSASGVCA